MNDIGLDAKGVIRLLSKMEMGDCWNWTASLNSHGYGQFMAALHGRHKRPHPAHRVVYELLVGPIPEGLELDHLCRNRRCVNPDHLEPVTRSENIRRGAGPAATRNRRAQQTHCKRAGHPLSGDNLRIGSKGERTCRACRNEQKRTKRALTRGDTQ